MGSKKRERSWDPTLPFKGMSPMARKLLMDTTSESFYHIPTAPNCDLSLWHVGLLETFQIQTTIITQLL
jgi:hypothetical protein